MSNKCPYAFVKNLIDLAYASPSKSSYEYFNGDDLLTVEIHGEIPHYYLECAGIYSPDGACLIEPSPSQLIELLKERI